MTNSDDGIDDGIGDIPLCYWPVGHSYFSVLSNCWWAVMWWQSIVDEYMMMLIVGTVMVTMMCVLW